MRAAGRILEGLGAAAERVVLLDARATGQPSDFPPALNRMSPSPWPRDGMNGPAPLALGALLARMVCTANGTATGSRDLPELPFASVEVDAARYSLCGLCALCPTGAIRHREDADRSDLTFHYAACTGCGLCRKLCPERAIRLTPLFAPARLAEGPLALVGSILVRCASCRSPIAPAPMLEAIRRRMAGRQGAPDVAGEIAHLCPGCRLSAPDRVLDPPSLTPAHRRAAGAASPLRCRT